MSDFFTNRKVHFIGLTTLCLFWVVSDLARNNYAFCSLYSLLALLCLLVYFGYSLWSRVFVAIEAVASELEHIIKGVPVSVQSIQNQHPVLAQELEKISDITLQATKFTQTIGKKEAKIHLDESIPLNAALLEMERHLQRLNEEEQKRNWVIQGVAELGDVIRQHLDSKVEVLTDLVLKKMISYLNANQAGIYLANESSDEKYIELVACYAYDRKKYLTKRIGWGEGLVGECVRDESPLFLTDVPHDYLSITSGLGTANPRNIVLCPIKTNERTIGAIEIASFEIMDSHKTELISKVCESLATTIVTVQNNRKNIDLLGQAEHVEQTLREKEEVLMQNAEELTATQEELNKKLLEIQIESNLNKNILDAINKSNAMVEYDMQGHILDANDLYLNIMGYQKEELLGKTEEMLLPNDVALKQNLAMLWTSLGQGQFNSGQFKRLTKSGEEVWVEASFNPILDINGKLMKVLMFAQFISDTLARENELKNKIAVLNDALPYAEIGEDWKVKNGNTHFMAMFALNRKTCRGYELISYLAKQVTSDVNFNDYFKGELEAQKCFKTDLDCLLPDGKSHRLHFVFSPLKDLNGHVIGTGIIINEYLELPENKGLHLKIG